MMLATDESRSRLTTFAWSRFSSFLLLCAFFWIVAAASHAGFMDKWALQDIARGVIGPQGLYLRKFGIESMLDRTAIKPWVYRQLIPLTANAVQRLTPARIRDHLVQWMADKPFSSLVPAATFARATSSAKLEFLFRYAVVYYLSFLSLFLALFVLRQIILDLGISSALATITPAIFLLALPYLMTLGGYFYDNVELLFLSLAFLAALRGKAWSLLTLVAPATLNKETFIFFLPALYPVLRCRLSKRTSLLTVGFGIVIAGCVNLALRFWFRNSPGGSAEIHLIDNLKAYLTPSTYFHPGVTYGLVGPEQLFLGTLLVILLIVVRSWSACPHFVKQHLVLMLAINLPLVIVSGLVGELRNFSFLYVGFVILMALALARSIAREGKQPLAA
jgi:hypothetical protein